MTETHDLVTRLLAAIAETERIARAVRTGLSGETGPWITGESADHLADYVVYRPSPDWAGHIVHACSADYAGVDQLQIARHIARQDPHSTLIRCAADRKILGLHDEPLVQVGLDNARFVYCQTCGSGEPNEYPTAWPCDTILALAEGYGLAEQQGDQP